MHKDFSLSIRAAPEIALLLGGRVSACAIAKREFARVKHG
jgi:hypothetical protein